MVPDAPQRQPQIAGLISQEHHLRLRRCHGQSVRHLRTLGRSIIRGSGRGASRRGRSPFGGDGVGGGTLCQNQYILDDRLDDRLSILLERHQDVHPVARLHEVSDGSDDVEGDGLRPLSAPVPEASPFTKPWMMLVLAACVAFVVALITALLVAGRKAAPMTQQQQPVQYTYTQPMQQAPLARPAPPPAPAPPPPAEDLSDVDIELR